MESEKDREAQERWRVMRAANTGLGIAGPIIFLGAGGYWLDRRHGDGVRFTLIGLALGLFVTGYELWKLVADLDKK